ncbi:MAG TPA: DUF2203 domain-containing protein [Bryobacteraceae bacterium]|jgi:hypothetical protein|nr:DUF2203 domain-containing protein [Bryobacteraceae bacterium]
MPDNPRAPRFFTLGEAERILPQVEETLRELMRLSAEGEREQAELRHWLQRIAMSGGAVVDHSGILSRKERLRAIAEGLQEGTSALESYGCLLKDVRTGLIDFPTLLRGKEVYLCWKLGEESIRFWHGVSEGFAGRKKIDSDFIRHHAGAPSGPPEGQVQ